MTLTLERCNEIQKELEQYDREIDSIVQTYYLAEDAQNIGGNIGTLSRMHASLVEQLAERKRELEKSK
jgi:hypothetical protein